MAVKDNLPDIDQNASYKHEFAWFNVDPDTGVQTPIPLDQYSAKIELRKRAGDPVILATWSTQNGRITISGNVITIFVPYSEVVGYSFTEAEYDLILWRDDFIDDVTRLVKGLVKLDKGVTRR